MGRAAAGETEASFLAEAEAELIGLAASAPNAGQVKVSVDRTTNPPSIRALVDNSGDEPLPSALSRHPAADQGRRQ